MSEFNPEYFETAEEQAEFEAELEVAWNEYNHGARLVDCFEDNFTECAHGKGFYAGYMYAKRKFKNK